MSEEEHEPYEITYEGEEQKRTYVYKDGRAKAVFPNEDTYEGPYVNRLRHGTNATYTFTSVSATTVYTGDYARGKRHGHGTLTYPDGSKYAGDWADGKRHGHGTYTYANGDKYVGAWQNDQRNGNGTYFYKKDGTQVAGEWRDGQLSSDNASWSWYEGKQNQAKLVGGKVDSIVV